jgi:hypothetical protein
MEEEEKKEAIEKTGVDYDKLKEIISTVYPVRYEKRTAIAPLLWICGAMFTTSLVWCSVNVVLVEVDWYRIVVAIFALLVAGVSFGVGVSTICGFLKKAKATTDEGYDPKLDLLRSEHFLLEMKKLGDTVKKGDDPKQITITTPAIPLQLNSDDEDSKTVS